jgi:hypothetical protein
VITLKKNSQGAGKSQWGAGIKVRMVVREKGFSGCRKDVAECRVYP